MNPSANAQKPVVSNAAAVAGTIGDPATVLEQLESVLIGKRQAVQLSVASLLARGHVLIEDVPGVGKTTLARGLAMTLGLDWTRVQFTNDLLPADVLGVSVFERDSGSFRFQPGPIFTSVLLADEINRAPPKAQSALLEAMEERQVSIDGQTHALPDDFFVIATQNPSEQLGAFPLPESQLDRFLVGLSIGLPDAVTERRLLEQGDRRSLLDDLPAVVNPAQLRQWSREVEQLHVDAKVFDYLQALIQATRDDERVGLSPRAGIALVRLSRAWAWLERRDHVLPDDVQAVFPALAGHRLTGQVASGREAALRVLDRVACP